MATKFKVTKTLITEFCEKGMTVAEMAAEITKLAGEKCAPKTVTVAAKQFGIDLRKKNRPSAFEIVDDTLSTEDTNESTNEVETVVNATEPELALN